MAAMTEPMAPREDYQCRLAARQADASRLARLDRLISNARLAFGGVAIVVGWLAWGLAVVSSWWLAAPVAVVGALVVVHGRVIAAHRRAMRSVSFYQMGLGRLDGQWMGHGEAGDRFLDPSHLYAADLDLFGRGSLFERLCTARTQAGEETLAAWLLAPAHPSEIRARQDAIRELRPLVDLREDLSLVGADVRAGVHPVSLAAWGTAPAALSSMVVRGAAGLLALAGVATLSLWGAGVMGPMPFLATAAVDLALTLPLRARVRRVTGDVDVAGPELALLADILSRLERERFSSPRLVALRAALDSAGAAPSRRIARLGRLIEVLDVRRNQLVAPFAYLLLWGTQCAHAIEAWRAASGPAVPTWLAAVGEFEALCALAGYAWENPADPFPEVVDGDRGPRFEGDALGHPLLGQAACIRNDVHLNGVGTGPGPGALVVSGSNMSGKSTLLRTVGVNAVLALAGAPVRADRLVLTPLAVGATLRIHDSLQDGTSRFYAEITRLRKIVDLTSGTPAALFLLDEMLNGTNSHDRRIGAEGLLRSLIGRGGIGLVTTHDLALSQIADALAPRAANVHFEDRLEGGRMSFDYVCRPGVVTTSNALALMRAVGIEV